MSNLIKAAIPLYARGDIVEYTDHHNRRQTGEILHVSADWYGNDDPLIVYTIRHPTARNNRQTATKDAIHGTR